MILKNYKACKMKLLNDGTNSSNYILTNVVTMNGEKNPSVLANFYSSTTYIDPWVLRNRINAVVGTGTTEPTADDYALENDVTESFSNVVLSEANNLIDENYTWESIWTISGLNNTEEEIIITEVGLYKNFYASSTTVQVLFVRHLLDTPIAVKPNETFKITLTWTED